LNRYHLPSEDEYLVSVTVTAASKAFVNKENDIAQSVESKKGETGHKGSASHPFLAGSTQPPAANLAPRVIYRCLDLEQARPTSHRSSCLHHQLYNILRSPSIPLLVSQSIRTSL
jgi:hypothetical protein